MLLLFFQDSGSAEILATASLTQGQTLASTGTLALSVSAALTQGQTLSAAGTLALAVAGALSQSQSVASAGTLAIAATASLTQAQTVVSTGTLAGAEISATAALTQTQAVTTAAALAIAASDAATQAQTAAVAATIPIAASVGIVQGQTLTATILNFSQLADEVMLGPGGYWARSTPKEEVEPPKPKRKRTKQPTVKQEPEEVIEDVVVRMPGFASVDGMRIGVKLPDVVASGATRIVGSTYFPSMGVSLKLSEVRAEGKDWRDSDETQFAAFAAFL